MMDAYWFVVRRINIITAILIFPFLVFIFLAPPKATIAVWPAMFIAALPLNVVLTYGSTKRWRSMRPSPGEWVIYSDTWAGGWRKTRWSEIPFLRTHHSNRLVVEVTANHVYIRPYWFMVAYTSDILGVLQCIPLDEVSKCERRDHGSVLLEWPDERVTKNLVLSLKDPGGFQAAVGPQFATGYSQPPLPTTFAERYLQGP